MNLDERSKKAVQRLGDAINAAVEESSQVEKALEDLRRLGYEANFSLKLEIGLSEIAAEADDLEGEVELELTEEDLKTLRKMKINL